MGREDLLRNVPLFSALGDKDLERLAKLMVDRPANAGDVIIREGEQAAAFFLIESGKVEVFHSPDGNPETLATLGPGDYFGEMALFEGFPRNATVRAIEDTRCLAMTRWDFTAELKSRPEIAMAMVGVLVRRLREVERHHITN